MQARPVEQDPNRAWPKIVAIVFAINALNYLDRQVPFILIEEIKRDLRLNDAEMGLISGLTFTLVYSAASIPLARLADRWSAKWVLTMAVTLWCGLTALSGQARSILQFGACRVGVAVGEAGCTPTCHALLTRLVPLRLRPLAIAIFSMGLPIGGMLGLILGGWLGDEFGWRMTMVIVGAPGILLAIVIALSVPSRRDTEQKGPEVRTVASLKLLFRSRTLRWIVCGVAIQGIAQYAVYSFAAAYLIRSFGVTMTTAGFDLGIANGISGVLGLVAGGWVATVHNRRALQIGATAFALSAPIVWVACSTDNYLVALILLAAFNFCSIFVVPSTFSSVQRLAPEGHKAMASSLVIVGIGIVGGSLGPVLAGLLSDSLTSAYGRGALGIALSFGAIPVIVAAIPMYFASRGVERELQQAEQIDEQEAYPQTVRQPE